MNRFTNYQSLFILFFTITFLSKVQAQDFEWANFVAPIDGSAPPKEVADMTMDSEGNIYMLGDFRRNTVAGEDTIKVHAYDKESCYLVKYSPDGKFQWINPIGGTSYDFAGKLAYMDGHIFASALIQGDTVYHRDGKFANTNASMILKFDTDGNFVKAKQFENTFRFDALEVVGDLLYAAKITNIFKLNTDLETKDIIKLSTTAYVYVEDMQNINDESVIIAGYFTNNMIFKDTTLAPSFSGEGNFGYVMRLDVETDSLHWVHAFGKVRSGLRLAYNGFSRWYLAGNYTTDFDLAGHLNPLYKFNGSHGFVAEALMDGTILKSNQIIPTEHSGWQELFKIDHNGSDLFVAGKTVYGGLRYEDSDTLSHHRSSSFGYILKLSSALELEYMRAVGPENVSSGEINAMVADGDKLYFGGRSIGNDLRIGCDAYNNGYAQMVFQMIDQAPDEKPIARFYFSRPRAASLVRFYSTIENADWHYWDFGDGSEVDSLAIFPRHVYDKKGAIEVTLHAGNKCGETIAKRVVPIEGIGSIIPKVSGQTSFYIGNIKGVDFKPDAIVKLVTPDGLEKEIRQVHFEDSATYSIMVEFRDNPRVTYDLIMEQGDDIDTLKSALTIEETQKADIYSEWSGPPQVLIDRFFQFNLIVENLGNSPAYGVPITIVGPDSTDIFVDANRSSPVIQKWMDVMEGKDFRRMPTQDGYRKVGTFLIAQIPANRKVSLDIKGSFNNEGIKRLYAYYDPPMFPSQSFFEPDSIAGDSLICPDSRVIRGLLELYDISRAEAEAGFNLSSLGCVQYSFLLEMFGGGQSLPESGFGGGNSSATFLGGMSPGTGVTSTPISWGPMIIQSIADANPGLSESEVLSQYDDLVETIPRSQSAGSDNSNSGTSGEPIVIEYPEDIVCVGDCELTIWRYEECPDGVDGCGVPLEPLPPKAWFDEDGFEVNVNPDDIMIYPSGDARLDFIDKLARAKQINDPSFFEWMFEALFDIFPVYSRDPNEKYTINGFTAENYIEQNRRMNYHITFENMDSATAPASEVFVFDTLDLSVLDTTNFSWNSIGWGNISKNIEQTGTHVIEYVDTRPYGGNIIVEFEGRVDENGILTAVYTSLDTATWDITQNVFDGFLPPNKTAPEGEGFFNFSIGQKKDLPHGTRIENSAMIIFDRNEPIFTGTTLNTIDHEPPVSRVVPFDDVVQYDSLVTVQFDATDDGSGVEGFNVFIKENSGPYTLAARNYKKSEMKLLAHFGDTLSFFITSNDLVGNIEQKELKSEARIAVAKKSSEAQIESFSFGIPPQTIEEHIVPDSLFVEIEVARGTDVSNLIADFNLSEFAEAYVNGEKQESGVSTVDFSSPVIYQVVAQDSTILSWTINVNQAPNSETEILSYDVVFSDKIESPVIQPNNQSITFPAMYSSDLSAVVATFTLSEGATALVDSVLQESGVTTNDFSGAVSYLVVAEDGVTTQEWIVSAGLITGLESILSNSSLTVYPNPASTQVSIEVNMENPGKLDDIAIYNEMGQLVKSVSDIRIDSERYRFDWNCTNTNGSRVPTGLYLIRVTMDGLPTFRKVIVK